VSEQAPFEHAPAAAGNAQEASRIDRTFTAEESDGLRLATKGRCISLASIAVLLVFVAPFPGVFYYHGLLVLFFLLGIAYARLSQRAPGSEWYGYALVALDFSLLGFTLLYPNPFATVDFPPQIGLRSGNFVYFFVLLCGLAFSYRPRMMVAGGVAGALVWGIGVLIIVKRPETTTSLSPDLPLAEFIETILAPHFVDIGVRLQEIVVFLIVAGLLAVIVGRSRRLVLRQVASERERGNLARYFPPNMVDRLSHMDAPLAQTREQKVAVLFTDIVGFTRWSEAHSPTAVIALLREVHARFEVAVFEHSGTLDKFIGDGVMATFGTPEAGAHDPANALRTVHSILSAFDGWNAERAVRGEAPVQIALGLHYGTVVIGDIGSERRMEFAVLGDTVNVASRLERLTREVKRRVVISDEIVQAVRESEPASTAESLLKGFEKGEIAEIRGRQGSIRIWSL
jgi:adenylate cyclase